MTYFNRKPIKKGTSKRRRQRSGKPGKLGIVRMVGRDMEAVRLLVFERDGYRCQWEIIEHLPDDADVVVGIKHLCNMHLRFERGYPDSGHLAHIRTKRNNGDLPENLRLLCSKHHLIDEHNPKPCPPKAKNASPEEDAKAIRNEEK